MGIIAKDNGEQQEQAPTGMHPAVCVNVFDIGFQPGFQGKPPSHKIVLLWELTDGRKQDGKRFLLTKLYTLSLYKEAILRKDLVAWRTKDFTEQELKGFDLDNVKRKQCQLNLVSSVKNNSTYINVDAVLPKAQGDISVAETGEDFIPEWVKKKMDEALPPPAHASAAPPSDDFTDDIPF